MLEIVYEGLNDRSEVYLSKVYFCKMYPTCESSKLCEFIKSINPSLRTSSGRGRPNDLHCHDAPRFLSGHRLTYDHLHEKGTGESESLKKVLLNVDCLCSARERMRICTKITSTQLGKVHRPHFSSILVATCTHSSLTSS